ncbi:hypothetical protein [Actinoallomurus acanthiterrae]
MSAGEAPTATATSLPHAQVYFLLHGALTPVTRTVAPWDTQAVFDALLAGPTAQESAHGLRTQLTPDVTIRVLGPRSVFVEYSKAFVFASRPAPGYIQVYCTALLLPGAPIVKTPGILDQKLQAEMNQKARDGSVVCPGAPSGANGLPPAVGETPTPTPGGLFPSEAPSPTGPVSVTKPSLAPHVKGVSPEKPQYVPKPGRSG